MIHVEHKNNNGMHNFTIWDDSGWIQGIMPTSNYDQGKYDAHQIALCRQGKLQVEQNLTVGIR